MSRLRAEDVKEALEAWDIGVLGLPDGDEWTVPPEQVIIVAAARAWLTPNYDSAWQLYYRLADRRHKSGLTALQVAAIVDAALHPRGEQ